MTGERLGRTGITSTQQAVGQEEGVTCLSYIQSPGPAWHSVLHFPGRGGLQAGSVGVSGNCSPQHLELLKEVAGSDEAGSSELHRHQQKTEEEGDGLVAFLVLFWWGRKGSGNVFRKMNLREHLQKHLQSCEFG